MKTNRSYPTQVKGIFSQFSLRVATNGWKQTIWAHTMYVIHVSVPTPYDYDAEKKITIGQFPNGC